MTFISMLFFEKKKQLTSSFTHTKFVFQIEGNKKIIIIIIMSKGEKNDIKQLIKNDITF